MLRLALLQLLQLKLMLTLIKRLLLLKKMPLLLHKVMLRLLQLPQLRLLLCKNKIPLVSQNMTGMSIDSPTKPSLTHSRLQENQMVHIPTTDMLPKHGLLLKETNMISPTKTLMRRLLDSSEPTKTLSQSHLPEEIQLIQSMDGITNHHPKLSPKETPRISPTKTSMRKLFDSSEPTRT
jgi:hypothetical protein